MCLKEKKWVLRPDLTCLMSCSSGNGAISKEDKDSKNWKTILTLDSRKTNEKPWSCLIPGSVHSDFETMHR